MSTPDSKSAHRSWHRVSGLAVAILIVNCLSLPCSGQLIYQQIDVLPAGNIPGSATFDPTMGANPLGQLIEGFDGKLYGTASTSDFQDFAGFEGSVFRVNKDGSNFTPLWKFGTMPYDGSNSLAGVVQAIDGSLYGTTYFGGTNNLGTVFRLSNAGNGGYTNKILKSFTGINGDGANPACTLILGTDGFLYGTTVNGGTNNVGTIFKLLPTGAGFTILRSLATASLDGSHPYAGVVQGTNGMLFGTCSNGGPNNAGVVFRIATNGTGYTRLRSFGGAADGTNAVAGLVCDTNNTLYGVTRAGGTSGFGTIFKINADSTGYAVLASFTGTNGNVLGAQPRGSLIIGADGLLYGTTEFGGLGGGSFPNLDGDGVVFRVNKNGSGYSVLHMFTLSQTGQSQGADGADPQGGLLQGSDGAIYGMSANGGENLDGTIFSLGLPPSNDNFANRIPLVGPDAIASGFNLNATLETNEPGHTNLVMIGDISSPPVATPVPATNSVWWSWGGLPNGMVTIQDDANTVDAIIDVYTSGGTSGLVDWWRGENNGNDSAGANNATLVGGIGFATGFLGNAFSFDGIDDRLRISASAISPPWSAEFWVNRQATTNDSAVLIGDVATALKLEQYQNTKKVGITVWNVKDYTFNYTAPIGTWTHLVFVGRSTNVELYANGVSQGTIAVTNFTLPRGTIGYDEAQGNIKQLKGLLDEISLYNRNLSASEIQGLYTQGKTNLLNLVSIASSSAPHVGLSNRVSFTANSSTTYHVAVSGTVQENMGPNFAGSGPISLSMRTLDLKILSLTTVSNANSTLKFTNAVQIGNAGTVPRGPLRLELIAQAGFSTAASSNAGTFLLPDQLLGTFVITNPITLAPGTTTTTNVFGVCPAPTNYIVSGTTNAIGWGVFAQLEEQVGTNWFVKDKDLLTYSIWPTNNGFQGPGGGVIRINPTGGTGVVRLTNTMILGPLTVNEGATNAYQGFARFSDGGTFTFSNTVWTASRFTITTNGLFHSDPISSNTPVTLGCYYVYDNKTNNATTNITVLDLPGPRLTNFVLLPSKQFQFTVNGVPGRAHVIETSTGLLAPIIWTPLATNSTSPSGAWLFTDPASATQARRFYRAHEQ